ncbi:endonuclease domain-containing protein [Zavarzinia aquatilis]|uniref:DUF559 domain-containing protein n=1 Tax=Zavarzinia aquatilis TaxID=2211142 RepID=A0A317E616_9PROT|nr:DUF559 domain-containing protein [Zavarzinia aquatilis]PWR22457.1 hypothetical protein DKG74_11270 [Zavarzinia aquatilis]
MQTHLTPALSPLKGGEGGEVGRDATSIARRLRRDATEAEKRLWSALRQTPLPCRLRRQHPVGKYIADFALPEIHLVIELDGGQHAESVADDRRTAALAAAGWRVIRFWNHEVLGNTAGVVEAIVLEVRRRLPTSPPVLESLPPRAGGEGARAVTVSPSPPFRGERVGVRWGRLTCSAGCRSGR